MINPADDEDGGPLGNPKILARILNLVKPTFPELQYIRLVSRLWHELTLDYWRSVATLKLIQDVPEPPETCTSATLASPTYQRSEFTGVPMSEFLSSIVDPSDPYDLDTKPFSRVKLKGIDIENEMEYCSPDSEIINVFPRIWELIGAFVTYLHCEECTFENTNKMGAFQKLVLEKTPFLKTLVMTNTILVSPTWEQNPNLIIRYEYNLHFRALHIIGDFPMGLANFLPYVPKIEKLQVRNSTNGSNETKYYFSTVWVPIANLRRNQVDMYNFKVLDFMHSDIFKMHFSPHYQFRATSMPLRELSLEVSPFPDVTTAATAPVACSSKQSLRIRPVEELIGPMLRDHKRLKVFKIFRAPFSESVNNFPFGVHVEGLEELELWGNVTESLNFLKYLPALRRVYINTTCFEKWGEMKDLLELEFPHEYQPFREDIVKFTGCFQSKFSIRMEYLAELHIEILLGQESIQQLAEWLPNIKIFRNVLDRNSFRAVCAHMKNLKELGILFGSEVDNEAITGVAPGIPKDGANLTALKRLKRLKLDAYCGKGLLKDSAVYLGFLKMTNLYRLEVCVGPQMSDKAEEELKAHVPYVRLIRNYGAGPHAGYECCERWRFVKEVMRRLPALQPTTEETSSSSKRAAEQYFFD